MKKKIVLWIVFMLVAVHFLKDITQDVLKIPTVLDLLGNVNEDISSFPRVIQLIVIGIGYLSFLIEAILLLAIPAVLRSNKHKTLEKFVWVTIVVLVIYFILVIQLDPRYSLLR